MRRLLTTLGLGLALLLGLAAPAAAGTDCAACHNGSSVTTAEPTARPAPARPLPAPDTHRPAPRRPVGVAAIAPGNYAYNPNGPGITLTVYADTPVNGAEQSIYGVAPGAASDEYPHYLRNVRGLLVVAQRCYNVDIVAVGEIGWRRWTQFYEPLYAGAVTLNVGYHYRVWIGRKGVRC